MLDKDKIVWGALLVVFVCVVEGAATALAYFGGEWLYRQIEGVFPSLSPWAIIMIITAVISTIISLIAVGHQEWKTKDNEVN